MKKASAEVHKGKPASETDLERLDGEEQKIANPGITDRNGAFKKAPSSVYDTADDGQKIPRRQQK